MNAIKNKNSKQIFIFLNEDEAKILINVLKEVKFGLYRSNESSEKKDENLYKVLNFHKVLDEELSK